MALRQPTPKRQAKIQRKIDRAKREGYHGIRLCRGQFEAWYQLPFKQTQSAGVFDSAIEAAKARDAAVIRNWHRFNKKPKLNFPRT